MPRHKYKKIKIKLDKVYNSHEVAKLISYLMIDGEKTVAEKIVYDALDEIKKQGQDPLRTLHQAIDNTSPNFEVKPRRLGGASYLVPIEVRRDRRLFLALNWIIAAAKSRANKEYHRFSKKLLAEIVEAAKNQGQGVAKKQATEKLAETNKAFSHLKW
ncbi:MAG: 30S ribosomal protein S7 [Candidatus Roizmanbacteria bacterium]